MSEFDPVHCPEHYARLDPEPITVIEAWRLPYHLGNVLKYLARAGHKGDTLEDLRKARWYLDRYIALQGTDARRVVQTYELASKDDPPITATLRPNALLLHVLARGGVVSKTAPQCAEVGQIFRGGTVVAGTSAKAEEGNWLDVQCPHTDAITRYRYDGTDWQVIMRSM